ncbi:MAG: hypothetical protein ACQZ3M_02735 [cyanobacterium endosymbiont of Rhopalodia fuxianensis]
MVIPIQAARKSKDTLKNIGAIVAYYKFNEGHQIFSVTLNILQQFIYKNC